MLDKAIVETIADGVVELQRKLIETIVTVDYLTECTLATLEGHSQKKSISKGEIKRQISIAQKGIDLIKKHYVKDHDWDNRNKVGARIKVVLDHNLGNVEGWYEEGCP